MTPRPPAARVNPKWPTSNFIRAAWLAGAAAVCAVAAYALWLPNLEVPEYATIPLKPGTFINTLRFSPRGDELAYNWHEGFARWDVARRQPVGPVVRPKSKLIQWVYGPDSQTLFVTGFAGISRVDVATDTWTLLQTHDKMVNCVAVTKSGEVLSGGNDDRAKFYDPAAKKVRLAVDCNGYVTEAVPFATGDKALLLVFHRSVRPGEPAKLNLNASSSHLMLYDPARPDLVPVAPDDLEQVCRQSFALSPDDAEAAMILSPQNAKHEPALPPAIKFVQLADGFDSDIVKCPFTPGVCAFLGGRRYLVVGGWAEPNWYGKQKNESKGMLALLDRSTNRWVWKKAVADRGIEHLAVCGPRGLVAAAAHQEAKEITIWDFSGLIPLGDPQE